MKIKEQLKELVSQAREAFFAGDLPDALEIIGRAKKIDPERGVLLAIEATMRFGQDDDLAMDLLKQAVELSPNNYYSSITYFVSLWGLDQFKDAANEMRRYWDLKHSEPYIDEIRQCIREDPKPPAGEGMIRLLDSLVAGDFS